MRSHAWHQSSQEMEASDGVVGISCLVSRVAQLGFMIQSIVL